MTPDELDFGARKYSHRFLWVGLLDSGNLAIADSSRTLITIIPVREIPQHLMSHLEAAYARPFPESETFEPKATINLEDLDVDLQI